MIGLLNKTNKAAKVIFDQTKKRIGEETGEFAKSVQRQVGIEPGDDKQSLSLRDNSSIVNEIITQGGKIPDQLPQGYEEQVKAKTNSRLEELEQELKRIRLESQRDLGEYNKVQEQLLNPRSEQQGKEYLPQTSKPNKNRKGDKGKARGVGEVLKNKK